jgi:ribonuclease P protein component
VSTRYLALYTFPREDEDVEPGEPRVGLAVSRKVGGAVARTRLKRRLRAALDDLHGSLRAGHDHVLVVRPGLAESAESRGFGWLVERVDEVLRLGERPERGADS